MKEIDEFMKKMGINEFGIPEEYEDEIPDEVFMYDLNGNFIEALKKGENG